MEQCYPASKFILLLFVYFLELHSMINQFRDKNYHGSFRNGKCHFHFKHVFATCLKMFNNSDFKSLSGSHKKMLHGGEVS